MKEIKFKTSEGEFYVADEIKYLDNEHFFAYKLSDITEEQASEIVGFQYMDAISKPTAIESLHSLLESKGIHLFKNPYEGYNDILLSDEDNKKINDFKKGLLEQKTFYNPYIFKLND